MSVPGKRGLKSKGPELTVWLVGSRTTQVAKAGGAD